MASRGLGQRAKPGPPPTPTDPAIAFNGVGLVVMNTDGSNQTQVYSDNCGFSLVPSWSPLGSGTQLDPYSIALAGVCAGIRRIDVAVVNGVPQGSSEIILLSGDYVNPAWSPAGDEIAVDGYATGIFVVPAGGGAAQTLYTPPAGRLARCPTWSPDASQITFVEQDESGGTNNMIKILERDTGTVLNTLPLGPGPAPIGHTGNHPRDRSRPDAHPGRTAPRLAAVPALPIKEPPSRSSTERGVKIED